MSDRTMDTSVDNTIRHASLCLAQTTSRMQARFFNRSGVAGSTMVLQLANVELERDVLRIFGPSRLRPPGEPRLPVGRSQDTVGDDWVAGIYSTVLSSAGYDTPTGGAEVALLLANYRRASSTCHNLLIQIRTWLMFCDEDDRVALPTTKADALVFDSCTYMYGWEESRGVVCTVLYCTVTACINHLSEMVREIAVHISDIGMPVSLSPSHAFLSSHLVCFSSLFLL